MPMILLQIADTTNLGGGHNSDPNWIVLMLLGAVVGTIVSSYDKIWRVIKYAYKNVTEKSHIEGDWFGYHWTYKDNKPFLVYSNIKISKGIWHQYKVELTQKNTTLTYDGFGTTEGSDIVITFMSKKHPERLSARFPYILASKDRTYGLWLSYDHDRKIASGVIVLSTKEIPDDQVAKEIKLGVKSEKDIALIHIIK